MGRIKDLMIERMEESAEEQLAHKLGLSYDELQELNYKVDTDESDDGIVYNYVISFAPDNPVDILKKVKGLNRFGEIWLTPEQYEGDYYYEEQYRAITSNKHFYHSFLYSISNIQKLNEIDIDGGELTALLKSQLFISVIASVEAFLSESFINLIDDNPKYFRNFIESYPEFKERKIELARIFIELDRIKDVIKKTLTEMIYHNLAKVSKMYASTFNIEFPDIAEMSQAVSIRHDLVHRNGKKINGEKISLNQDTIASLIGKASDFATDIAKKLGLPRVHLT